MEALNNKNYRLSLFLVNINIDKNREVYSQNNKKLYLIINSPILIIKL